MMLLLLTGSLLALFPSPAVVSLDGVAQDEAVIDWRAKFERCVEEGDLYRAVDVVEDHLDHESDDTEAWRLHARTLERLVADAGATRDVYYDAAFSWGKVLELAPYDLEALRAGAEVRMRIAEYGEAAVLALHGIGISLMVEGTTPSDLVALACRASVAAHVTARFTGPEEQARDLARTWAILERARTIAPGNVEAWTTRIDLLDWLGLPERAVESLVAGIVAGPGEASLHRKLIDLHVREGIEERLPDLYGSMGADPTEATFAWYTGYVARLAGDLALKERRFAAALRQYGRCEDWMGRAAALEPAFATSSEELAHQARVAAAWSMLEAGELAGAEEQLRNLCGASAERCRDRDGLGRSAIDCLAALGDRYVAASDFAHGADIARFVTELLPEDGIWWNNLAFMLREYGTQLEVDLIPGVDDHAAAAREVFRESWVAYLRAVALTPDTPFVPNDAAIIQVYHLHEELERAEQLLRVAIRVGEGQLADMDDDTDRRAYFPVAQAVGDAYQNLGYLYYHIKNEPAESRPYWVKCKETGGGDRSFVEEYLDAIDHGTGPVPRRDPAQFVTRPVVPTDEDDAREPTRVWWHGSLEEARRDAEASGQELLAYNHGHGLGLAIPPLDGFVASERFAVNNGARVLAVGDSLRHTFVDRRRDGSRVLCPVWRTITCAEHLQCHAEFGAWFQERHGRRPGQPAEGFWLRGPGDEDLHLLVEPEEFQRLVAPSSAAASRLPAPTGDAMADALALLETPVPPARDGVEAALFDPEGNGEGRQPLVEELARQRPGWFRALLPTMVRQENVPTLAEAALRRWPDDLDLAPVTFAARWSTDAVVRELAKEVLARLDPSFAEREAARRILDGR